MKFCLLFFVSLLLEIRRNILEIRKTLEPPTGTQIYCLFLDFLCILQIAAMQHCCRCDV